MSESYWPTPGQNLELSIGHVFAQTFTPLFSHDLEYIRVFIKPNITPCIIKVAIQYLNPDGTPAGQDLTNIEKIFIQEAIPPDWYFFQEKVPLTRIVTGINYALLLQSLTISPFSEPLTLYEPAPSNYPRGKLIKSTNWGRTWNLTDLGDLNFAEWGEPPKAPNPHNPPPDLWGIQEISQNNFTSSACIRVATTEPCMLTMRLSRKEPIMIKKYRIQRGTKVLCFNHYGFKTYKRFFQLEPMDSLYHTFYPTPLYPDSYYWFYFTAEVNAKPTKSTSPIFKRLHPAGMPPFSTIRRPAAPGTYCEIPAQIGDPCPNHWRNLDDPTPDENTTYIWNTFYRNYYRLDTYKIDPLVPSEAPIASVTLIARLKYKSGYSYASKAKIAIKPGFVVFYGPEWTNLPSSWTDFSYTWPLNPSTGQPWTIAEVNALEIGIALFYYEGIGWATQSCCTQLYATIDHECKAYY